MSFVHGKTTKVLVDEFDLSSPLNQLSATKDQQAVNVTGFGIDDLVYLAGIEGGSVTFGGLYDADAGSVDAVFTAALEGSDLLATISPQGAGAVGDGCVILKAGMASYQIRSSSNDAVRVNAALTPDGGVRFGSILHELAAETGAANGAGVDYGASTPDGAIAHLHVTAFSGTSATIKVTDSPDDGVYSDLITFGAVTAVGSERAIAAGTVNRWTRYEISGTFTSVTFAVSFVRNIR